MFISNYLDFFHGLHRFRQGASGSQSTLEPQQDKRKKGCLNIWPKKKIYEKYIVYASHHRTPEAFVGHKTVRKMNDLLWQSLITTCSVCQWQAMVDPQSICCNLLSIPVPSLHAFNAPKPACSQQRITRHVFYISASVGGCWINHQPGKRW